MLDADARRSGSALRSDWTAYNAAQTEEKHRVQLIN